MRQLPYHVTVYDTDNEPTSQCNFPTEQAARKKFDKCVVSAECANVGRILLTRLTFPVPAMFRSNAIHWENIAEWIKPVPEPDFQVEGYIVQSIRTLDKRQNVIPVGGEFFDNEADAIEYAESLAKRWSVANPGLLVFKAVVHVHKEEEYTVPRKGTRILVDNVE